MQTEANAARSRVATERRAGELLADGKAQGELASRGGDRKSKSHDAILKLPDLGITLSDASRWQQEAQVPRVDEL